MSLAPTEVDELLRFAVEISEQAAEISLRYFRVPLEVQNKLHGAGFDPVTRADREVETFLREKIAARYPDHGIVGEEHGTQAGDSALEWIIDPIDGTRAFISGATAWGSLLGVSHGEKPVAGVVHVPFTRETFFGSEAGAFTRRAGGEPARLQTRMVRELCDAVLYCTHPASFTERADLNRFEQLAAVTKLLRYGGDCYSYCLLALGHVDLVVEGSLQPYDIIPLIPIIEAAGGVVTDVHGEDARHGGVIVAAGNRELHAQALAMMRR